MVNEKLREFFKENNKVAIGFSGGVDSSYLLYAGKKCGAQIQPYFVKTQFQPEFELEDAKNFAKFLDIDLKIIELNVLENEVITKNPEDRCYYCKNVIFSNLISEAKKDGFNLIVDGTNASDDIDDRPGIKALREMKVRSPLREAGLTKEEIRQFSKDANLFTWNKPSYACLATRIQTGTEIKKEDLEKVEKAEGELFNLGFSNFRIRIFHNVARLQMDNSELKKVIDNKDIILEKLKPYFSVVLLDLEGR